MVSMNWSTMSGERSITGGRSYRVILIEMGMAHAADRARGAG